MNFKNDQLKVKGAPGKPLKYELNLRHYTLKLKLEPCFNYIKNVFKSPFNL